MTYNDVLARELSTDVRVLILDYFKSREDEQQFPRELLYQFIERFDIFSLLLDSQDSVLSTEFLTFIRLISKDFPAFSAVLLTQACYGIYPILRYGTQEQKLRYLEPLVRGEILAGLGFSEGKLMDRLEVLSTTASKTEAGWSLTGKKSIVSNCRYTDILLILAKVQEVDGKDGYGFFIVDTTRPGITFGDDIVKPGLQGLPVNSVTFDQVILPEDSLLGLSAISIGISEGAFEKGLAFVKVKRGFGKRLIDATVYQHQFADLYTKLCAAEAYFASYKDRVKEDFLFVSQIKLYTTKVAIEISEELIRLIGPLQTLDDIPIDRYLKDAKTIEIYGKSGDSIRKRIAAQWIKE